MPIVAGVDRSNRAESVVIQGHELARKYNTKLHVVHVGKHKIAHKEGGKKRGHENAREEASEIAASIAIEAIDRSEFKPVGLVGDAAEQLLEYGSEHDAEYLVVCARKRTRLDQAIFGGVSQLLILNADRPVVAVP